MEKTIIWFPEGKPSLGRILGITKIVIGNLRSIADIIRLITSLWHISIYSKKVLNRYLALQISSGYMYIVQNYHYKIRIAKGFEEVSNNKYPAFTNGRLKILRRFCLKLFPEHILYITRRCKKKRMPTICDIFRISRVGDIRKRKT